MSRHRINTRIQILRHIGCFCSRHAYIVAQML